MEGIVLELGERLIPAHAGKTHPTQHQRRTVWAHPRSRGENLTGAEDQLVSLGSSPLTRGKHLNPRRAQAKAGLIPAHAGKTRTEYVVRATLMAHPRSRGENSGGHLSGYGWRGSSPLTRGKLGVLDAAAVPDRLIPAHAGKTRSRHPRAGPSGAHPRSRGENSPDEIVLIVPSGSSPLTRGKRAVQFTEGSATGLIPAHAGKTAHRRPCRCSAWAHPRSRGENSP